MPTPRRHLVASLAVLLALAACAPPGSRLPGASPKPRASGAAPRAGSGARVAPARPPAALGAGAFGGAGVVGQNGARIVTDNGAGLVTTTFAGVVRAQAAVIGNNGGAIVTDNGAGLVSDAGGGYRLTALAEVPYAGATVHLLDAAGRAIAGPDGQPLTAVADDQGRYALTAALPADAAVVLAAQLPGAAGQLGALAPPGATRAADLDAAGTLLAGYVLERFVRPQADPQGTLDRLPAALAASARGALAGALAGEAPVLLTTAGAIAGAVEALRTEAAAVDAQLEAVRRALLVGLPDLGAGRLATEVALPWIRGVVAAPGGGFWLSAALAGRVMFVGADGRLATHAGTAGGQEPGPLTGKPAAEAGLGVLQGLLPDGDGLLILEQRRLTRRDAAGTLTELWPLGPTSLAAVGRRPGGWWLLARDGLWRLAPGAAPAKAQALDADAAAFVRRVTAFGQDAQGRLALLGGDEVRAYDPAAGTLLPVAKVDGAGVRGLGLDADGGLYVQDAAGAILDGPGGAVRIPAAAKVTTGAAAFAATPDGATLWALLGQVQRVVGATKTLVAGKAGVSVDADGQLALNRPGGLLVEPDGALLVAVAGDGQVVRVARGEVAPVARDLPNPTALRRDAAGNRYVLQAGRSIARIAPDGAVTPFYVLGDDLPARRLYDFALTPDGATLYLSGADTTGTLPALPRAGFVTRVDVATRAETAIVAASPGPTHVIALDAERRLHLIGGGQLRRWADGAFTPVASDPRLATSTRWTALGRAAFDARGRLWWFAGDEAETLCRLDGAQVTVVAGKGGTFLTGDGVDDGLLNGMAPVFTADGDVLFCDVSHNQVKRLAGAAR